MANVSLVDSLGNPRVGSRPSVLICLFSYGGTKGQTLWALTQELRLFDKHGVNFLFVAYDDDALISRSRSKALSAFLQNDKLDVCVMVDHDVEWEVGELLSLAMKCHMVKSCVSGIYSARAIGGGMSSRPKDEKVTTKRGEDQLIEAEYLGGGFLAIPRVAAEEVLESGKESLQLLQGNMTPPPPIRDYSTLANCALHPSLYTGKMPLYDFFRPICVPRTVETAKLRLDLPSIQDVPYEYLSEDWAFSWRCTQANPGRPLYLWSFVWLKHYGDFPYTMATAFAPLGDTTRAGAHPTAKVLP